MPISISLMVNLLFSKLKINLKESENIIKIDKKPLRIFFDGQVVYTERELKGLNTFKEYLKKHKKTLSEWLLIPSEKTYLIIIGGMMPIFFVFLKHITIKMKKPLNIWLNTQSGEKVIFMPPSNPKSKKI